MIISSFLRLAVVAAAASPLQAGWHSPEQRLEISSPADCRKWFESQEDEEANAEVTIQSHGVVATDNSQEPLSGCRRKVVKSRGGKKVEMSPCLVPNSNVRGRERRQRLSSTSTSTITITGTNTKLHNEASTSYHQHQHHNNNIIDSELDDYSQLQELLRQKNIPLTVPVLVVVDCKIDETARKEESHDRQRRRTHTRLPPEQGFTTVSALAVLVVAVLVSRLKVKIEFKLDLGGHPVEADAPAVPLVVTADASAPPVVMVDAVAINNDEPQAVAVQG